MINRAFEEKEIELVNPVVLTVSYEGYSMPVAVGLLSWLERNGAVIKDTSWKFSETDFGNLVEKGIKVEFEEVVFKVTSSFRDIYFERLRGNKIRFQALCKLFYETEL